MELYGNQLENETNSYKSSRDLIEAVVSGNTDKAASLIKEGASVNCFDDSTFTPLHHAAHNNDTSMITLLASNGAAVDICTRLDSKFPGVTPLHIAVMLGNTEATLALHNMGANLNALDGIDNTPLHYCVINSNCDLAKRLIFLGADVTLCSDSSSALHHAAELGMIEMINLLVKSGCPPDLKDENGSTPTDWAIRKEMEESIFALKKLREENKRDSDSGNIHLVAVRGNINSLELLVKAGISVNTKEKNGYTPLHFASFKGFYLLCKKLIALQADVNATDNKGLTALIRASMTGHKDIVLLLIEHGANVTWLTEGYGGAIHQAAIENHWDIIKCLVDNKCPVNLKNLEKWTPLHLASSSGRLNACKTLLSLGADINVVDNAKFTPLMRAYDGRHEDVIQLLIGKRVMLTSWGPWGSAIHQAASSGLCSVIKCLIQNGCPVDLRSVDKCTPLHFASSFGSLNACRVLVSYRAKVNIADNQGYTPLMRASQSGHDGIVLFLLENGANMTWVTKKYGGAIHQAASEGHCHIIKCLVDKNCPVNLESVEKWTPLHFAAWYGSLSACKALISLRTNVNSTDNEGFTPLMRAAFTGHENIVLYLIEKGANVLWLTKGYGGALHQAAYEGFANIVEHLVRAGVPANQATTEGYSPLHYATLGSSKDSCKTLLPKIKDDSKYFDMLTGLQPPLKANKDEFQSWVKEFANWCVGEIAEAGALSSEKIRSIVSMETLPRLVLFNKLDLHEVSTDMKIFLSYLCHLCSCSHEELEHSFIRMAAISGDSTAIDIYPNSKLELRKYSNVQSLFAKYTPNAPTYVISVTALTPLHVCLDILKRMDVINAARSKEVRNDIVFKNHYTFIEKALQIDQGIVHDILPDGRTPLDLAVSLGLEKAAWAILRAGGQRQLFTITDRELLSEKLSKSHVNLLDTIYQKSLEVRSLSDVAEKKQIIQQIGMKLKNALGLQVNNEEDYKTEEPSEDLLMRIVAPEIKDIWLTVARQLKLEADYIETLRDNVSLSSRDKAADMLIKWLNVKSNPTWKTLIDAIYRTEVTFEIKELLSSKVDIVKTQPQPNIPNMRVFNRYINPYVAAKWMNFALCLGVKFSVLERLQKNYPKNIEKCCSAVFERWIKKEQDTGKEKRTWDMVKTALLQSYNKTAHDNLIAYLDDQPLPDDPISSNQMATLHTKVVYEVALDWERVGTYLKISDKKIAIIKRECLQSHGMVHCCLKMFHEWLNLDHGTGDLPRTWNTVVKAISDSDNIPLAEELISVN